MILFAGVGAFAGKTPFGRQVYAVGGNERAAELSGIYVKRIKMAVYMICGLCGAMTGLISFAAGRGAPCHRRKLRT